MTTVSCLLQAPAFRERKAFLQASLKPLVRSRERKPEALALRFEGTDHNFTLLTEFIKAEKQCCGFMDFTLSWRQNELELLISGPEGTGAFLENELEI